MNTELEVRMIIECNHTINLREQLRIYLKCNPNAFTLVIECRTTTVTYNNDENEECISRQWKEIKKIQQCTQCGLSPLTRVNCCINLNTQQICRTVGIWSNLTRTKTRITFGILCKRTHTKKKKKKFHVP